MPDPGSPLMRLRFGDAVRCTDDLFGELADVVVDPRTMRVTHLVVEPHHDHGRSRLVALALAEDDRGAAGTIVLGCKVEDVQRFAAVHDVAFLEIGEQPPAGKDWDVGVEEVQAVPYSALDGLGASSVVYGVSGARAPVAFDRVPKGEAEVRRSSAVLSADGRVVGHLAGFTLGEGGIITEVVLEEGHLWRQRDVTVPAGALAALGTDQITLTLSADEVRAIEGVRVHRRRR